jgi:predicted Zn-dependent peptidase
VTPQSVIRSTLLPSGLRVVTERMPDVRSVTAGFWVGTGSRDEDASISGASHFLEHLLFKGTASRSAREIAEAVDAVGGDLNAFTTKEYTAFYVRVLSDALEMGLDILCDIITAPAFRPDEVEAERQVILEEILLREDEPADLVHEVLGDALFPDHPLGREVLGLEGTVKAMEVDAIRDFFADHYRPGNMVFGAAGDLDHDHVVAGLGQRLGEAAGGRAPARSAPSLPARPVAVVRRQTEQAHVAIGVPAPDRHAPERWALSVLNHTLGGGLSSRLFQEIRERRGLAYAVYSFTGAYQDTGQVGLYLGTRTDNLAEAMKVVATELERLREEPASAEELSRAKENLKGRVVLALESTGARMNRLGSEVLAGAPLLSIDESLERIEAVTHEDLAALVAELWSPERLSAAGIGPDQEAFEEALAAVDAPLVKTV